MLLTKHNSLGVNIDDLLISQPDNGEQALEIADNLIRSGAIDILVVDSVAALTPKSEIEGEMEISVGLPLDYVQSSKKINRTISKTGCTYFHQSIARENRCNVW